MLLFLYRYKNPMSWEHLLNSNTIRHRQPVLHEAPTSPQALKGASQKARWPVL